MSYIPIAAFNLLESKIQLSKFEELIGFIKRVINLTAPHLASRMPEGVVQNRKFF